MHRIHPRRLPPPQKKSPGACFSVAGASRAAISEDVEVGLEGRHDVAGVLGEAELGEEGDGARDLGLGEEAEEADHGEAAVVDLDEPACVEMGGLLLVRPRPPM